MASLFIPAWGQAPPSTATAPTRAATPTTETPSAAPSAKADVPNRAEAILAELSALDDALAALPIGVERSALDARTVEIDTATVGAGRVLAEDASLAALRELEAAWQRQRDALGEVRSVLTARSERLARESARVIELTQRWRETLNEARGPDTPVQLRERVELVVSTLERTKTAIDQHQADTLALLDRLARQDARVSAGLLHVENARSRTVRRLFVKDAPPLWKLSLGFDVQPDGLRTRWTELTEYVARTRDYLLIHGLLAIVFIAGLAALARVVRARFANEPWLIESTAPLAQPIAVVLLIAALVSPWIYPDAPRMFWAIAGTATVIPTVLLMHRLADRRLFYAIQILAAFYLVDQLRGLLAPLASGARLLAVAELVAATGFAMLLYRQACRHGRSDHPQGVFGKWHWIAPGAFACAALCAAAAIAATLGYTSLADLLAQVALGGAYFALVLYAIVRILLALGTLALTMPPLAHFRGLRRHRALLSRLARRFLTTIAIMVWLAVTLDRLTLLDRSVAAIGSTWSAGLTVGAVQITIGHLLTFVFAIWLAALASRFVRFVLEEDVFPRVELPGGLPNAISTTLHYVIIVFGIFAGVATLGIDMTKLTILIGALTVGVGFGLQNIINNFVSGLILLFERPIKLGDVIQVDDAAGSVQRIGIRATVIRTPGGAEIIVPNANLISSRVTNWTRSNHHRLIEIPLVVAADTNIEQVSELLRTTAARDSDILPYPAPEVFLTKLDAEAIHLELHVWTAQAEHWMRVRSRLALAFNIALDAAGITIR